MLPKNYYNRSYLCYVDRTVSKLHFGDEVVHAVGGYQIVVPALLRMTDEILRGIVTTRASPYTKFFKSIPCKFRLLLAQNESTFITFITHIRKEFILILG